MSKIFTKKFILKAIPYLPNWRWLNRWAQFQLHEVIHGRKPTSIEDCYDLNDYWLMFKTDPRSAIFSYFVDKDLVKDFIKLVWGEAYLIPSLLVTDSLEEIKDFTSSEDYVIKPTHSSKDILFKKANSVLNSEEYKICKNWMQWPVYRRTREYQCHLLKPKFIIEPRVSLAGEEPKEYRFLTINGEVQYIYHDRDRQGDRKMQLYDKDWQRLHLHFNRFDQLNDPIDQPRPDCLDEMLSIVDKISTLFPIVRVDLLVVDDGIKFSEFTFTPANATQKIGPPEFYKQLWKKLPTSWPKRIL